MRNKIKNYKEFTLYKHQLQELLAAQKDVIHYDIMQIRHELQPAELAIKAAKKLISAGSNSRTKEKSDNSSLADKLLESIFPQHPAAMQFFLNLIRNYFH